MIRIHKSIVLVAAFAALNFTACGKSEPKPPPKAEDTVFGDYVKAKDRAANETQKAIELNQQKLDEAMKKQDDSAAQESR